MSYIFDTNMFMEDFDVNKYKGEKIYIPIVVHILFTIRGLTKMNKYAILYTCRKDGLLKCVKNQSEMPYKKMQPFPAMNF